MNGRTHDALVLDLDTRAGLSITRALARQGLRVDVAAQDAHASGFRTRYAAERHVLPRAAASFDGYVEALLAALRASPADATIPSIDASVEALHRNRSALAGLTAPALGSHEAVDVALDKDRTLAVARSLGIPVPRSVLVSTPAELDDALGEVGLPCVLKPTTSWRPLGDGGERLGPTYAEDAAQARSLAGEVVRPGAPVLLQEFAGGSRETIKLFRDGGRSLARLAISVERSWPALGGSSTMRATVSLPDDVLDHAERLVAEIGLDGYSEVEFRRTHDGRPLLMEVNPRLSQSVEVALRAGVDFARMQLEWARGGSIPRPAAGRVGVRVGWLAGDLRLLVAARRGVPTTAPFGRSLAAMAGDYTARRARIEGLDVRDLRPTLGAVAFAARALRARGLM